MRRGEPRPHGALRSLGQRPRASPRGSLVQPPPDAYRKETRAGPEGGTLSVGCFARRPLLLLVPRQSRGPWAQVLRRQPARVHRASLPSRSGRFAFYQPVKHQGDPPRRSCPPLDPEFRSRVTVPLRLPPGSESPLQEMDSRIGALVLLIECRRGAEQVDRVRSHLRGVVVGVCADSQGAQNRDESRECLPEHLLGDPRTPSLEIRPWSTRTLPPRTTRRSPVRTTRSRTRAALPCLKRQ